MSERSEIRAADAYCRYLADRHYENFSVASLVLPARLRQHLARIYAYCRTTDDFGDESDGDALIRLERWRDDVRRCFHEPAAPVHPVLLALRPTIGAFSLPEQPFLDLIAANLQDQTVSEYESWDDLRAYCDLSAAPVGRLVLRVFGAEHPDAERLSDDVCIGLQLANFAQDVSRDCAKGRTYLLQSMLRVGGLEGAVRDLCDRATAMLESGRELEALVPGRLRVQLALYRLGGEAIVDAIRRVDYHTDRVRPRVSAAGKARILAVALLRGGRSHEHAWTERTPNADRLAPDTGWDTPTPDVDAPR